MQFRLVVSEEHAGTRLDIYLGQSEIIESRSQLKSLLKNQSRRATKTASTSSDGAEPRLSAIYLNGKPARLSAILAKDDIVEGEVHKRRAESLEPEEIDLQIVFENDDVYVINKPAGMAVHPGAGRSSGTLANAILHRLRTAFPDSLRPGIVHRLDKDTTGIIIVAKNIAAHSMLADQFKNRTVEKRYLAIIKGSPRESASVITNYLRRDPHRRQAFICDAERGRRAVTSYRLLYLADGYSVVVLEPKTGRTHQLRAQMQYIGCPILGDPIYSRMDHTFPTTAMMLHAYSLSIQIPPTGERHSFSVQPPQHFLECMEALGTNLELLSKIG